MDARIHALGDNIFERAKKYRKRIQQSTCTERRWRAAYFGHGTGQRRQLLLYAGMAAENGSLLACVLQLPGNQNGEGTYCKHIGALLLDDAEKNAPAPAAADAIPVLCAARRNSCL